MTDPNNPHDALFRKTFSSVEHAAAELRAVLPRDLLARVDLATLALAPGSYVDTELASSQSDLLFTVAVQSKPGLLYLLFEHQSAVDELMPLRILKYVVRILDQHVIAAGGGSKALPLPVVIPVVLHHSATGWTAPTRFEELFDPELVADRSILAHVPRLGFVLDDISHLTDDELAERALGLLPTLTLWVLRDARSTGRLTRSFGRWASALWALNQAESGKEALLTIFRYISLVADDLTPGTVHAILTSAEPKVEETLMTLAEQWKAEGRVEGEVKGRVEGEAKGRRGALVQLLSLKFGALPAATLARIETASEDQLLRWTASVLTADSLAAVLVD